MIVRAVAMRARLGTFDRPLAARVVAGLAGVGLQVVQGVHAPHSTYGVNAAA